MDWLTIGFGALGGLAAGIINTISGSGSTITLSLMAFFGIPTDIANGSNRIGILVHGLRSSVAFKQKGHLQLEDNWRMIIFCIVGAIMGTSTALYVSAKGFDTILGWIFLVLLILNLFEPQKRLQSKTNLIKYAPWLMFPIGFYGGFIQVATGLFLLSVLRTLTGKSIQEINPLKVFIIMLFNIPAIIIFAMGDKINWGLGISLAIGQYFGAIIGVRINSTKRNIEPVLKYLLVGLIVVSIAKFWGWI